MTKRRPRHLIYADLADAYKCIREGKKVKRNTNKDGSINTKPVVPVDVDKSEKEVSKECITWLRKQGCVADRHNVGAGKLDSGRFYKYGIIGHGDIEAILPNGLHAEIECKHGTGGKWSISQQRRKKKIERVNALYYIVHGIKELKYYLEDYSK